MAIGTGSLIDFFGTQDEVTVTTPSAVTDDSFSVTADINAWTNDDDALTAKALLVAQWAVAPTVFGRIKLYARLTNIHGSDASPVPSADYKGDLIASFRPELNCNINTDIYLPSEEFILPNLEASQRYEFYIENNTGQTISAGWDLHIGPKAAGAHA